MISTTKRIDDDVLGVIAAAGHSVWIADGVIFSTDDAAVQLIINGYTLDQAKAYAAKKIEEVAKARRDAVVSTISPAEMASWFIKVSEAAKYAASGLDSDAPLLSMEAAARGISVAELVGKVAGNANGFRTLEAAIGGTSGRHRDAVKALTTFAEVYAYDFGGGWPV